MDLNNFLNLFNLTAWQESESLEWKLSTREHKEIVQTLVAFANKSGGVLVCGVDDKGAVYGQDISDGTVREITQTILANSEEKIYPQVSKLTLQGKSVLVIQVEESPLKPHIAYGRPYIRVGTSNVQMSQSEYGVLLAQKQNGGGADRDLLPDQSIDSIDLEQLQKFIEVANQKRNLNLPVFADPIQILSSLELMNSGILNKAALLLFGKNPQSSLPQAEMRAAFFKDEKRDVFLDQKVYTGNLFEQYSATLNFAKQHLPQMVNTQEGAGRLNRGVKAVVLEELIANALVHRDYRDISSSYFNIIDKKYFEVSNPGALPTPKITPELLKVSHASVPINRRIARVFFLAGLIEQWGEGTRRVCRSLEESGLPEPVWKSENGSVVVRVCF